LAGLVHIAVRVRDLPFRRAKAGFALFLGRLSPEKGLVTAIEAATHAGLDLVVAAKASEAAEQTYLEIEIKPRLGHSIHWVGEADRWAHLRLLRRVAGRIDACGGSGPRRMARRRAEAV
jgi:glycosyltransferase involved in cell wall biosynthesis